MRNPGHNKDALAQQAAEWTEALRNPDARARAAFDEWLMESPRHVREFLLMTAVDRALHAVDPQRKHDVQALLAQGSTGIVPLPSAVLTGSAGPNRRRSKPMRWAAAFALLALTVAVAGYLSHSFGAQTFTTGIGEQRTVQLADGSVVFLNTRSRLKVHMSAQGRELRLLQGQALFKVQRDSARPFRVHAGKAVIQALGTQFDIYQRPDATTTVSVLEGRVRVSTGASTRDLAAGEAARLTAGGTVNQDSDADVAATAAWRERRLKFRRDTLADVVAEFNRYNHAPRLRLEGDEALAQRHYSGEFDADDPESLLQLLATDPGLSVSRTGEEILVRARPRAQD